MIRRALLLVLLMLTMLPLWAADRVALMIGNASYQNGALLNPVNDATDIGAKLETLGFQVFYGRNLDREGMVRRMQEFRAALRQSGIGLFFYSGHAVEIGGRNYLLPVNNADIRTVEDVEVYGLEAQRLLTQMEASGTQLNVVILDACRDNPLPSTVKSAKKGLARMEAQQGTIIAYATREGQTAADGNGRNSPYSAALLKFLGEPGLEISGLFNRVGLEVSRSTLGEQVPWVSSSPVPPVMLAGASSLIDMSVSEPGESWFQPGSCVTRDLELPLIDELVETLHRYPDLRVEIVGHADGVEPDALKLSACRANRVKSYMEFREVAPDRIVRVIGAGNTQPIDTNQTAAGRARNRRVEANVLN